MKKSNRIKAVSQAEINDADESLTIGIDLGDRRSHVCVLNRTGEILREEDISTSPT